MNDSDVWTSPTAPELDVVDATSTLAGRYTLLNQIGEGGMGTVYRAHDRELDDEVAVKLLRPELANDVHTVALFRREARLARRVTHRNVARTFEFGAHGRTRFLVMELVLGRTLAEVTKGSGPLSIPRILAITSDVCAALAAAHDVGVVHRDVKPGNVILANDGRTVLTDFGIARNALGDMQTIAGGSVGTPAYMAPEQLTGEPAGPQADVYAVGVMLFELLSGRLPFAGRTPYEAAFARLRLDAPTLATIAPHVEPGLAAIVDCALRRDPLERFASARALDAALCALTVASATTEAAITPVPLSTLAPAVAAPRLAVLPLDNLGTEEFAHVAEGLSIDLISALSELRGLRVLSYRAVRDLDVAGRDAADVAAELGVDFIVEGTLRPVGGRVRTTLRAVDAKTASARWTHRGDCNLADVLTLQDQLAGAIGAALGVSDAMDATPAAEALSERMVDRVLRARAAYDDFSPNGPDRAVGLYEDLVADRPADAELVAAAALAILRRWVMAERPDPADLRRARTLAEQARALDPSRGSSWLACGMVALHNGKLEDAVRHLRHAVARAPSLADAQEALGMALLAAGDENLGQRRIEAALKLAPDLLIAQSMAARVDALRGRWSKVDALEDALRADPGKLDLWLSTALRYVHWRADDERLRDIRAAVAARPADNLMATFARLMLGVLDGSGDLATALAWVGQFAADPETGYSRRIGVHEWQAELAALRGDADAAFEALRQASAAGHADLLWIDHCPTFATLRQDPRFAQVRDAVRVRSAAVLDALWEGERAESTDRIQR